MEKILTRKLSNHQRFKLNLSQFSTNSTMCQFLPRLVDQNESRNSLPNPQNPSPKHRPKKTFAHEEIYEIVNNCHTLIPCHHSDTFHLIKKHIISKHNLSFIGVPVVSCCTVLLQVLYDYYCKRNCRQSRPKVVCVYPIVVVSMLSHVTWAMWNSDVLTTGKTYWINYVTGLYHYVTRLIHSYIEFEPKFTTPRTKYAAYYMKLSLLL